MTNASLWTLSVTPATQMTLLQACYQNYLKMMNQDYAPECLVSCVLQLSLQWFHLFRSKNHAHIKTLQNTIHLSSNINIINLAYIRPLSMHVYCIPPINQNRWYKVRKPTNSYHTKNMHLNVCLYSYKSLYSYNRQNSYKVKYKI